MAPRLAQGRAYARAALAGNPSDGYGGAVLAVTLRDFAATAVAELADIPQVEGPRELMEAAVARFPVPAGVQPAPARITCATTIPRQVGLGGSSAIVIATLRALCELHGLAVAPDEMARAALAAETEELGLAAGPQDRFAQAHEGLVLMDFAGDARVEDLDPEVLPPLFVAYRAQGAAPSGVTHAALRRRSDADESRVNGAMAELGELAREGASRLRARQPAALGRLMDRSFDIRASLLDLAPSHVRMIEISRGHGASANYAGSGGAIIGTRPQGDAWLSLRAALAAEGYAALEPTLR